MVSGFSFNTIFVGFEIINEEIYNNTVFFTVCCIFC
jgi:hypothetical protein